MSVARHLYKQNIDVVRTVDGHNDTFVATTPWGRTEASYHGGRHWATFYDLRENAFYLDSDAAKLAFEGFQKVWETEPGIEMPTTPPDRDYAGYDYLVIERGRLFAIYDGPEKDKLTEEESSVEVLTYEQYLHIAAANDHHVLVSSSVDFPHEHTDHKDVIALCQRIRGGE